jgi:hypothetical protein
LAITSFNANKEANATCALQRLQSIKVMKQELLARRQLFPKCLPRQDRSIQQRGKMMAHRIIAIAALLFISACSQEAGPPAQVAAPTDTRVTTIDDLAGRYLVLELAMGEIAPGHVDAYFGPDEFYAEAKAAVLGFEEISNEARVLMGKLQDWDTSGDELLGQRVAGLLARLEALDTRIAIQQGQEISFDEEVLRGHFDYVLAEIDALIPGEGPLNERVDAFLDGFNIPEDKLTDVIDASIAECKRRTEAFIDLPADESFTVEYVTDKPWSGYNWYQGDSISLIQINTDFPSRISSGVRLGCHEGYPGHHVYNTLLEQNMVNGMGWLEFSLYPLFSPQSLIAEGSANYGIELAFPGDERIEFEKNILFPMAGLDPDSAEDFYRLLDLQAQLNFSRNEAARGYLNGDADAEQTLEQLMKYSLTTRERAGQSLSFVETYRSYVINYNHGKVLVADYIERGTDSADDRWAKFRTMLSTSLLPEDLTH